MIERDIWIDTGEGQMNTFVIHPDEEGPHPVILFLMDAPGKREELHQMARRMATCGYWVMLPNLYYRRVEEFVMDWSEAGRDIMFEHMNSLSNSMVTKDCRRLLEVSKENESASKGFAGCVGYCMSGPFAFAAATEINDRIRAAASIHGVRLFNDSDHSPHRRAEEVKGELYFGCAEIDEWAPREMIDNLEDHLSKTNVRYRIEWYPKTEHGFVFPEREAKYQQIASERHWHRILSLFERNLKFS